MKKLSTLLVFVCLSMLSMGQDASVTAITTPVTGCALSPTESVTIVIHNYGANISGTFNASYVINGGTPVTEAITATINTNSNYTYAFTQSADLSAAGSYNIDAYTDVTGDTNNNNDTLYAYNVVCYAPSGGGSVTPTGFTVCAGSNSGLLTLGGHTGSVVQWEYSTDGGSTWNVITNTTTSQSFLNLTQSTQYRAVVKNGSCSAATSIPAVITVQPQAVGGTTASSATVCSGSNSGTITLTGHVGNVIYWEYSTNSGSTWTVISNTTTSQAYLNLTQTTWYHAVVQSGFCSSATSTDAIITVDPVSVGGTISGGATVCSGNNSGVMVLSGHVGNILSWQFSTDGGSTWLPISNTTINQTYNNITVTTMYRAVVQSGVCPAANSTQVTLTVIPPTVGGNVTTSTTVCSGANSGALNLGGHTGTVQNWEFSVNSGGSWTGIVNNTTTQTYLNLTQTTWYRAVVQNGSCPSATSTIGVITVDSMTVAGTVSASATVCNGSNSGTLNLTGKTGNVVRWEYSVDGGSTWTPITNTTTSYSYNNIIVTTMYRAVVQKGVCPALSSTAVTITVDPKSVGGTVSSSATVCSGSNSGTLTLAGHTGSVVSWLSSINSGSTWTVITNTTTSQTYLNLTQTTWYRALVKSGVCSSDSSSIAKITVNPQTVGGTVSSSATVCSGTNSGTLTLAGHTGTVLRWEYSTDGGSTWITISNTTTSQAYTNLTITTMYRAVVQSGVCTAANSSFVTLTVSPKSVGGTASSSSTVCSGNNSGTSTLTGHTGSVVSWLSSINSGGTWTVITNTTTIQPYLNITQTTWYRAVVQSGVCAIDSSSIAKITVDPVSIGGTVNSNSTQCFGNNTGTLTLTGHTGTILRWEYSTDNGNTWVSISNTTTTQNFSNLLITTMYRVVVQSGVCSPATSTPATITIILKSVGGVPGINQQVCEQNNGGNIILSAYFGTITGWQSSTNSGGSWTNITNTTSTQAFTNLTMTTWYRAIVQNGTCTADTSSICQIIVHPKPAVSFTTGPVCLGNPTLFSNTTTISTGFVQSYQWDYADNTSGVGTNPTHTFTTAGVYSVMLIATSDKGCMDTAVVNAVVYPLPNSTINASGQLQFCSGDSITLSSVVTMGSRYIWSTADTVQSITVKTSGWYKLTLVDSVTSCVNSDSVNVTVFTLPSLDAGLDTAVSLGNSIQLEAVSSTALTYSWLPFGTLSSPSVSNPIASPTVTTTYTVMVSDVNGCMVSDSVTVKVNTDYKMTVSNLMTPNGDGKNDTWFIENIQSYGDNTVMVYNRFGAEVFKQEGYANAWDGGALPDGTYYYVIKFANNADTVYKGALTIMRDN